MSRFQQPEVLAPQSGELVPKDLAKSTFTESMVSLVFTKRRRESCHVGTSLATVRTNSTPHIPTGTLHWDTPLQSGTGCIARNHAKLQ